jgi:hypothetical protein
MWTAGVGLPTLAPHSAHNREVCGVVGGIAGLSIAYSLARRFG